MSKWISFKENGQSNSGKTKRWLVVESGTIRTLGDILWYATWRKYAFSPLSMTVFEEECLRDIADFCERETKQHKEKMKGKVVT